jgi:uncharacterized protein YecT (DUF1311 family)
MKAILCLLLLVATMTYADTQLQLNMTADQAFKASDSQLNTLYKEMLGKYDQQNKALLIASERAWITYRDAECKFETAPFSQGSIYPMYYAQCLTDKTNQRIVELKSQLNCKEGDPCNLGDMSS